MTATPATSSLPIGAAFPWLAPLAGFSDLPFRLLCREQGAAVACTEMVSAKGLLYGMRKKSAEPSGTEELLATTPEDKPLVVQLFGDDPQFMGAAARELADRGFTHFDLNMGCSVPKVTRAGAGAALLRDTERAVAVARELFRAAPGMAGCKIRLGWDASTPVFLDLARRLEGEGAAWITLHPRYARQGFGGAVDSSALERLAASLSIPVIASGDLFSAEDGLQRLKSGASGVMFARGAMTNPAVFSQYLHLLKGDPAGREGAHTGASAHAPDVKALLALVRRHAELARRLTPGRPGRKGLSPALLKMRTVVPRYVRHLPGVKRLRLSLTHCESWEALDEMLREFFPPTG